MTGFHVYYVCMYVHIFIIIIRVKSSKARPDRANIRREIAQSIDR